MSSIPLVVDTEWLAGRLEDPKLRLVDVTTYLQTKDGETKSWAGRETYQEAHIPGAVYADILNDFSDPEGDFRFTVPPRNQFVKNAEKLGLGDPDTYIVVYDSGYATADETLVAPYWATRFAWQLRYEGAENVAVLDGGFAKWKQEDRPTKSGEESYPETTFEGERKEGLFVGKEEVKEALDKDDIIVIDSLLESSFESGHIPGSCNIPFNSHSDMKTLEMVDEDKLKSKFEEVGALDPDKKVITYCGGGIAATWNAILLNKLGQKNVAVYDGSMSEWSADESLPIEK